MLLKFSKILLPLGLSFAAGCTRPEVAPTSLLGLFIDSPKDDGPFTQPEAAFISLIAEGRDIPENSDYAIQPFTPGMDITLPKMPFGTKLQVRVDMYSANADNQPAALIGRGLCMPLDINKSDAAPLQRRAYVTRTNKFSPAEDENHLKAALTEARIAGMTATLPDGRVMFMGGGALKKDAKSAFDVKNFQTFTDSVDLFDPDSRTVTKMNNSQGAPVILAKPRAFATAASGATSVVVVGGYTMEGGEAKFSDTIEFYNPTADGFVTSAATNANLRFARAQPTVIQMFANQDYFLILGGLDAGPCKDDDLSDDGACASNTWEVWHPVSGNLAQGRLSTSRWNHAAVRLPGQGSGFAMLIGGENAAGPLDSIEVIQFTGTKVSSANIDPEDLELCPLANPKGPADGPRVLADKCQPIILELPDKAPRILPGAVFVSRPAYTDAKITRPAYNYVYIVGGFGDSAKTKPSARIDIYDISGEFITGAPVQLNTPRGAPLVTAVTNGPGLGQVLVAGGSASVTSPLSSAEVVAFDDANKLIAVRPVDNAMPDGNRTFGNAIPLATGYVMLFGGVGGSSAAALARNSLPLWNPF